MELILKNWDTWMWSASILAGAILIALAGHSVLFFVLTRMARRKGDVFIKSLVSHGEWPSRWILPLIALILALPAARLSENVLTPIQRAAGLGLIAATAWLVILISYIVTDHSGATSTASTRAVRQPRRSAAAAASAATAPDPSCNR